MITNPSLQVIDKALSNPKAVIEDLAAFNGQNCFKYDGDCVDLNDNSAMSEACGAGYTVVGWDDAGCGTPSCISTLSGQCRAGEINIKGIGFSWRGGFVNDGDTNKCGRGHKFFCCPDPDYAQL
ncbi:hypothetical protein BJX63DRAFT_137294 [Aspergillus granulosus]|uniref:Uncharacterized protein n=1 Tax=Aspergillus granulosus TaxID=176169 RepID=A0ABR4HLX3_9EURO